MSTRRFLQGVLLLGGFSISACTAILVPNEDDDGVARCNTSSDCPDIDDNRYVAVCTVGDAQADNSDQICSSDYDDLIKCGKTDYPDDQALTTTYAAAQANKAAYTSCAAENRGTLGCDPNGGTCQGDLEVNVHGTCDDPDNSDNPLASAGQVGLADVAGRDVQDHFCRSYFCDERFVCDTSLDKPVCGVCNPNDPFGKGGCGTLYINGAIASVYQDVESTGNCGGNTGPADISFGPVNEIPDMP